MKGFCVCFIHMSNRWSEEFMLMFAIISHQV